MRATLSARRRVAIWTLIAVASLIGFGSVLTMWVDRQMLDTQSWEEASAELIEDAQVRAAVSAYLVDELYVDVSTGLEARLPTDLKPRGQQLWIAASATAQEKLVNVLEDDIAAIATAVTTTTIAAAETTLMAAPATG